MKRLINLYNVRNKKNLEGFANIEINSIEDIISCSADHIFCNCLSYLDQQNIANIIIRILDKIRPEGYCTLSFVDMKRTCRSYVQSSLSDESLIEIIKDYKAILSYPFVQAIINKQESFSIVQADFSDNYINIVIQRSRV